MKNPQDQLPDAGLDVLTGLAIWANFGKTADRDGGLLDRR
jgi:hypothetical protein